MRYFFVFLAIAVIWLAVVLIGTIVSTWGTGLFLTAQILTLVLFVIGFYKK